MVTNRLHFEVLNDPRIFLLRCGRCLGVDGLAPEAVSPDRVANSLGSMVEWLKGNDRAISPDFFALFGVLTLVRGLSGLLR